ncbi:MAG: type IV pilus secretin PilQ [Acidobacteria bacterium]|nr:type IV pilus secretin PilQ [Acidobacteriota bacterium]MDW7984121.1 type IV pilus secretin PilQ [Acidobacteriota bacterium]
MKDRGLTVSHSDFESRKLWGLGLILSLGLILGLIWGFMWPRPSGATELRDFSFHVTASATDLVFAFDSAVRPEVAEEGLDLVLRLPADANLDRLATPVSVGSPQVRRVWATPERHEVRIERNQVLPYEVRPQAGGFVLRVSDVSVRGDSEALPKSVGPNGETSSGPAPPVAPATARDVAVLQSEDTAVIVKLTVDGSPLGTRWKPSRLSNPVRWVFDIEPLRFKPLVWKWSPQHAWLKQLRVAQFQAEPSPVTRVVMEVTAEDLRPDVQVEPDGLRIALVRLPAATASHEPSATTHEPSSPDREAAPTRETVPTPAPAPPEGSSRYPETASISASSGTRPASEPPAPPTVEMPAQAGVPGPGSQVPGLQSPTPEKSSPASGSAPPLSAPDWDPRFFDTRDIVFYQAQVDPEAAKKAQELAIFKEQAITGPKKYEGEPITLEFTDVHVKDLMGVFSDISGLNILLDPKVEGEQYRIPVLRLRFVPWDQALDLVLRMLNLGYVLEGNVLRVAPIEDLRKEAEERQKLQENIGTLQTVIKPLSYADADQVQQLASRLLTPRGEIFVDKRTNTLIIKESDVNMPNILNLIATLDTPIPQVNIEVRIVETRRTFTQQLGIQWGFRGLMSPALGNSTSLVFPNNIDFSGNVIQATTGITGNPLGGYAVNLPTLQAPTGAMLLSFGSVMDTFRLDLALMALESAGLARVISSPRISTQNNQKANIQSGDQIPVQTIVNNTIQVQYVNATLNLDVTPQITADGSVILKVRVENKRPDFGRLVLGIPPILTQEAETVLLVRDGSTVVLGGIIRANEEAVQARLPWIHRIPILGWFFKNRNLLQENSELLIFLTPRVAKLS